MPPCGRRGTLGTGVDGVSGHAWTALVCLGSGCRCILRAGMKRAHEMAGSTHAVVRCKSNQKKPCIPLLASHPIPRTPHHIHPRTTHTHPFAGRARHSHSQGAGGRRRAAAGAPDPVPPAHPPRPGGPADAHGPGVFLWGGGGIGGAHLLLRRSGGMGLRVLWGVLEPLDSLKL